MLLVHRGDWPVKASRVPHAAEAVPAPVPSDHIHFQPKAKQFLARVVLPLIRVDLQNLLQSLHGVIVIAGELKRHSDITAFKKISSSSSFFFIVNTI